MYVYICIYLSIVYISRVQMDTTFLISKQDKSHVFKNDYVNNCNVNKYYYTSIYSEK